VTEDAYRTYKEDQITVEVERNPRILRRRKVRVVRSSRIDPEADYRVYKTTLASAVEDIKVAMHAQHEQTRAEVQIVRHDVLAAIKASPAEYLKLISEFGSIFLLFSLAIRFTLKIELVNTAFALFMLVALAIYWAMARLKEASDRRLHQTNQA
jgi:hypothetical protein